MPGRISETAINEIRQRVNIVDVVERYVRLQKAGGRYKGLCPFHDEKTPSFTVDPQTGLYYCFGCQAGGNVFNFLMQIEGWSFTEAVRFLADQYQITLAKDSVKVDRHREILRKVNNYIARCYSKWLRSQQGAEARQYLASRGLSSETQLRAKLGYAPNGWDNLIKIAEFKNIPLPIMQELGLVIAKNNNSKCYDRFRNRVMFPIHDHFGQVIGFGGRVMDGSQPKYLNSPETPLYHKGRSLYGLYQARKSIKSQNQAIIMEGYMDVLTAWQHGIETAVASLGTALTLEQAKLIKRYADGCVLCYDADAAGNKATLRGLELLTEAGLDVRIAVLAKGLDPDDYLRQKGVAAFREEVLGKTKTVVEYRVETLASQFNLEDQHQQIKFANRLVGILAGIKNRFEQEGYAKDYAEKYKLNEQAILAEIQKRSFNKDIFSNKRYTTKNSVQIASQHKDNRLEALEEHLLHIIIRQRIEQQNVEIHFSNSMHRHIYQLFMEDVEQSSEVLLAKATDPAEASLLARFLLTEPKYTDYQRVLTALLYLQIETEMNELSQQVSELNKVGEDASELVQRINELGKRRAKLQKLGL